MSSSEEELPERRYHKLHVKRKNHYRRNSRKKDECGADLLRQDERKVREKDSNKKGKFPSYITQNRLTNKSGFLGAAVSTSIHTRGRHLLRVSKDAADYDLKVLLNAAKGKRRGASRNFHSTESSPAEVDDFEHEDERIVEEGRTNRNAREIDRDPNCVKIIEQTSSKRLFEAHHSHALSSGDRATLRRTPTTFQTPPSIPGEGIHDIPILDNLQQNRGGLKFQSDKMTRQSQKDASQKVNLDGTQNARNKFTSLSSYHTFVLGVMKVLHEEKNRRFPTSNLPDIEKELKELYNQRGKPTEGLEKKISVGCGGERDVSIHLCEKAAYGGDLNTFKNFNQHPSNLDEGQAHFQNKSSSEAPHKVEEKQENRQLPDFKRQCVELWVNANRERLLITEEDRNKYFRSKADRNTEADVGKSYFISEDGRTHTQDCITQSEVHHGPVENKEDKHQDSHFRQKCVQLWVKEATKMTYRNELVYTDMSKCEEQLWRPVENTENRGALWTQPFNITNRPVQYQNDASYSTFSGQRPTSKEEQTIQFQDATNTFEPAQNWTSVYKEEDSKNTFEEHVFNSKKQYDTSDTDVWKFMIDGNLSGERRQTQKNKSNNQQSWFAWFTGRKDDNVVNRADSWSAIKSPQQPPFDIYDDYPGRKRQCARPSAHEHQQQKDSAQSRSHLDNVQSGNRFGVKNKFFQLFTTNQENVNQISLDDEVSFWQEKETNNMLHKIFS